MSGCSRRVCLVSLAALLLPAAVLASDRTPAATAAQASKYELVDLFAAQAAGEVDVRFIPRDAYHGRVSIANNSGRPLSVRLPEVMAGMPVLAQFNNNNNNRNAANAQQAPQAVGTAIMPGANQPRGINFLNNGPLNNRIPNGNRNGNGIFNIPAERTVQFRIDTLCLEHGKAEPRTTVAYELKPLDSATTRPEVPAVLKLYAGGGANRQAAQAATWHLANGLTWKELSAKRIEHPNGTSDPYFTKQQIADGRRLAEKAVAEAKAAAKTAGELAQAAKTSAK